MRRKEGISQAKLAEMLGINRGNIDSYEKNTQPKTELIVKIADYFGIDMQKLLSERLTDYNYTFFSNNDQGVVEEPAGDYSSGGKKSEIIDLIYQMKAESDLTKRTDLTERAVMLIAKLIDENNSLKDEMLALLKSSRK